MGEVEFTKDSIKAATDRKALKLLRELNNGVNTKLAEILDEIKACIEKAQYSVEVSLHYSPFELTRILVAKGFKVERAKGVRGVDIYKVSWDE